MTHTSIRAFAEHHPECASGCYIDPSSTVIGRVGLGIDSSIWPQTVVRGDVNYIQIGERSNVQDGCVLHVSRPSEAHPAGLPLIIGSEVTVGHKVMLHACTIGDRCLIGMGSIVLDGAVIEDEVLLGAGSLVPPGKRLTSGYLYLGSPVRQVRPLTPDERAFFRLSAENYVRLKNVYLDGA
ncbi:gamma carbonic anhydrase family protein [Pseudaeromonas paramecii]|uniref:Gamma carbonic anhydrase family protein n=1 Tax=Pseudaeromonas paramecii TaxID=2138166 RepID=A0ABP8Q1R3_9GAMM